MQGVRRRMQHQVERIAERPNPFQGPAHQSRQVSDAGVAGSDALFKERLVAALHDPGLVWHTRRIWTQSDIIAPVLDNSYGLPLLLVQDVAEDASFLLQEVVLPGAQFVQDTPGDERGCRQFARRMIEVLPGG